MIPRPLSKECRKNVWKVLTVHGLSVQTVFRNKYYHFNKIRPWFITKCNLFGAYWCNFDAALTIVAFEVVILAKYIHEKKIGKRMLLLLDKFFISVAICKLLSPMPFTVLLETYIYFNTLVHSFHWFWNISFFISSVFVKLNFFIIVVSSTKLLCHWHIIGGEKIIITNLQ